MDPPADFPTPDRTDRPLSPEVCEVQDQTNQDEPAVSPTEMSRHGNCVELVPEASPLPESSSGLLSQFRNYWLTWLLAVVTGTAVGFTIFFAYNASLEQPVVAFAILSRPDVTILFLSGASQVSMFLVGTLANRVLENVRWVFASRPGKGVSALSALALSPATGYVGVFALLFHGLSFGRSGSEKWKFKAPKLDHHRLWGCQR